MLKGNGERELRALVVRPFSDPNAMDSFASTLVHAIRTVARSPVPRGRSALAPLLTVLASACPFYFQLDAHPNALRICQEIVVHRSFADAAVALFVVPAGRALPLHDHTRMAVAGKLLRGRIRQRIFQWHGSTQA